MQYIFAICSTERKFIPFVADMCKGKRPWLLMPSIKHDGRAEVKINDISLGLRKADAHLVRDITVVYKLIDRIYHLADGSRAIDYLSRSFVQLVSCPS